MLTIALAQPPAVGRIEDGLPWAERFIAEAARGAADIICFPETFLPGLRGMDFDVEAHDPRKLREAREQVAEMAGRHRIHVIMPMELDSPDGVLNTAFVFSDSGALLGHQTKNQIAPEEDPFYVPGSGRQLFEVKGVLFGVVICHEGWRYPETVRWAATHGAPIVFHPTLTGGATRGHAVQQWGAQDSPYYEKAMVCRSIENGVFMASVNGALAFQEAATALIGPDGDCIAHLPYGEPGLLIQAIDPTDAHRLYARRFKPEALVSSAAG